MKYFFQALLLVIPMLSMCGCISSQRYAGYVKAYYVQKDTAQAPTMQDVKVLSQMPSAFAEVVDVKKGDSHFIPAFFYWGVKESFDCNLNAAVPQQIVQRTIHRYADTMGLIKKLHGRRLELTIQDIPTAFTYVNNTDVVFIVIYAFTMGSQVIKSQNTDVVLSYKVYEGQQLVKEGRLVAKDEASDMSNIWKSTKKITWAYLKAYNNNVTRLSKQCLEQLVDEL